MPATWTHHGAALAAAAATALSSPAAQAADPTPVVITGSRLSALDAEGASPVQVVTGDELRRSGAATLRAWLEDLPAGSDTLRDINGNGSFAAGASAVALRGMGKQATLVLLNGRRLAPYPLADFNEVFTNVDTLPFEAIERIEILQIGGAAHYGSDAVAGVVNVITRQRFDGVQLRLARQQSVTSGRFGHTGASLVAGGALPGHPEGRLLGSLELSSRASVVWDPATLGYLRPQLRALSGSLGSPSTYSWPGNVFTASGGGALPGCVGRVANGLCLYDRFSRFGVVPAARRANGLLLGELPLGDGQQLFAEALLSRSETDYINPFQPYGPSLQPVTWVNPATQQQQSFWYRGLPPGHPLNPGSSEAGLRYRFVDGPSQSDLRSTQYRLLAGWRGPWRLAGLVLDAEVAAGAMGGQTRMADRGSFSLSGFRSMVGNFDPGQTDPLFFQRGYRLGEANSPAVLATLFPEYGYSARVRQLFVDGQVRGEVGRWPWGPVMAVLGADLRHERHAITPSALLLQGDIVGNGLSASDGARWLGALFAEVDLPLAPGLHGQAAVRLDKHGAVAPHLSPRLALRWAPDARWLLRGTVETGFRAPNLTETAQSTRYGIEGVADPLRCPQATALANDLKAGAARLAAADPQRTLLLARADAITTAECAGAVTTVNAGNPALRPETARSASVGLVFAPSPDTRIAVDAWTLERRNEIGVRSAPELLLVEATLPAGTVQRTALDRDPSFSAAEQAIHGVQAGALQSITARFENTARTRNRGADLAASTTLSTPLGRLALRLDATYQAEYRVWRADTGTWGGNRAGRYVHPRWKAATAATWTQGAFAHSLRAITVTGTTLQGEDNDTVNSPAGCAADGFTPAQCRIAGSTRVDWGLAWTGLPGLTLSANVYNLFNKLQPVSLATWLRSGGLLAPTAEDPKGRVLRLALQARW